MSRARPLLLGVAFTSVALVGCVADESGDAVEAAKHVGTYEANGDGGDSALLEGIVRVVDGCFLVEDDLGARFLPYFPIDEVEWSSAGLRYGDQSYGEGDVIALGGGMSGTPEPMPANCGRLVSLLRWTVAQGG